MQRLELTRVRTCERCGRGRAELTTGSGEILFVTLDAGTVQELQEPRDAADVPWLSSLVLDLVRARRDAVREVVLDTGAKGLRALVTISRGDVTDVIACSAQEGLTLAVRGTLPLYATTEALEIGIASDRRDGTDRLH